MIDPMENHPITPPPDLVRQWNEEAATAPMADQRYIATQAARWGADQELAACCEWLEKEGPSGIQLWGDDLRIARRPKPPSLKEQALEELEKIVVLLMPVTGPAKIKRFGIIRRALEALPE